MAVYEKDFYQAKNLEGCIRDEVGNPRILCFKDTETNALGRIVLGPNPNNILENVGRSIVFEEPSHQRFQELSQQTNPPSMVTEERIGESRAAFTLYIDQGVFEPVTDQNRQELADLIDEQQALMEGHKGILQIALDMFQQRLPERAIPRDTPALLCGIMYKSHEHIVNANTNDRDRVSQDTLDGLWQLAENAPPIGLQSSALPVAHAYYNRGTFDGNAAAEVPVAEPYIPNLHPNPNYYNSSSSRGSVLHGFSTTINTPVASPVDEHPTQVAATEGQARSRSLRR